MAGTAAVKSGYWVTIRGALHVREPERRLGPSTPYLLTLVPPLVVLAEMRIWPAPLAPRPPHSSGGQQMGEAEAGRPARVPEGLRAPRETRGAADAALPSPCVPALLALLSATLVRVGVAQTST